MKSKIGRSKEIMIQWKQDIWKNNWIINSSLFTIPEQHWILSN